MSKYRSTIIFKDLVMSLIFIYLFYALANLFFVPNYSTTNATASQPLHVGVRRQIIHVNHNNVVIFQLGEKPVIEDLFSSNKSAPAYIQLTFNHFGIFRPKVKSLFAPKAINPNSRNAYLAFCMLRI